MRAGLAKAHRLPTHKPVVALTALDTGIAEPRSIWCVASPTVDDSLLLMA